MLTSDGQFIIPVPNCEASIITREIGQPYVKKGISQHTLGSWNPTEKEYTEVVNEIYDKLPLKLALPCFFVRFYVKKKNRQKKNCLEKNFIK